MSINELDAKVKELRELRRMVDELNEEIAAITDALKAHMTAENTDVLSGTDWKVSWKVVTTTKLDTSALKKAMPEIAAQFTKSNTVRRFCIA